MLGKKGENPSRRSPKNNKKLDKTVKSGAWPVTRTNQKTTGKISSKSTSPSSRPSGSKKDQNQLGRSARQGLWPCSGREHQSRRSTWLKLKIASSHTRDRKSQAQSPSRSECTCPKKTMLPTVLPCRNAYSPQAYHVQASSHRNCHPLPTNSKTQEVAPLRLGITSGALSGGRAGPQSSPSP